MLRPADSRAARSSSANDVGSLMAFHPGPGSGTWVPDPSSPSFRQSTPQFPIDFRDLLEILKGTLAPYSSVEIAPGVWWIHPPGGGQYH
jgi:hypothetical protein